MSIKERFKAKLEEERRKLKIKRARERAAQEIIKEKATVARHKAQERYAVKRVEAKEQQKFKEYKKRLDRPSGFSMGGSQSSRSSRPTNNPFGPATYITGGNPLAKRW